MRFSNIINNKANVIAQINPDRIYVENIRSFYNLPYRFARFLCEMAVKQRFFEKKYGLLCPNNECKRLIISFDKKSQIPNKIKCDQCELLEREKYIFEVTDKDILEFYKLTNKE